MSKEKIRQRQDELIRLVSDFCDDELDLEYRNLSVALVEKMGRKHDVPFKRGKIEIWASAVIYALAQINFLFDKSFEPYKSADDICGYFNTNKSTVSQKAKLIRDMFNMRHFDEEFSTAHVKDSQPKIYMNSDGFIVSENMMGNSPGIDMSELAEALLNDIFPSDDDEDDFSYYPGQFSTIQEFEDGIGYFRELKGEEYFEENKGYFWGLLETRPYMTMVLDYALLLWDLGKKEDAVDKLGELLTLNPGDNQGVRHILINYLIDLNRLEDAELLLDYYDEELSAVWPYSRLLIAIRNNENENVLDELYEDALLANEYVIYYILDLWEVEEFPSYYSIGEDSEAQYYIYISEDNWNDEETLKILKGLITNDLNRLSREN